MTVSRFVLVNFIRVTRWGTSVFMRRATFTICFQRWPMLLRSATLLRHSAPLIGSPRAS